MHATQANYNLPQRPPAMLKFRKTVSNNVALLHCKINSKLAVDEFFTQFISTKKSNKKPPP